MKKLKLDVIVNSGITNLDTEFEKLFLESTKISIATAFISNSSISIIENCLKQNNCEVQLVVGLYGGFNSKKDLLRLRKLTKKYPDKFVCKISLLSGESYKFYWQ